MPVALVVTSSVLLQVEIVLSVFVPALSLNFAKVKDELGAVSRSSCTAAASVFVTTSEADSGDLAPGGVGAETEFIFVLAAATTAFSMSHYAVMSLFRVVDK